MLEMDEGRLSFAEALRPPLGYRTSFVVGTTYSLDLRALLGVCIPLGLGYEPEALDLVNPVTLFAALQELQGRMVVYCDKGRINADFGGDARSRGLAILLEDMIHQVHVNRWHPSRKRRNDGLSSFHPKVWVVEYEPLDAVEEPCYRLLVMSRNLTFDTSWDVALSIDGRPGAPNACSEHLAGFLEFLARGDQLTSTERDNAHKRNSHTKRILRLAESIRSVEFEVTGRDFDSVDFLPFGPHANGKGSLLDPYECELATGRFRNLLVASPFLSSATGSLLNLFADRRSGASGRFLLLSCEDSLRKLDPECAAAYECYSPVTWLSDVALEGDDGEAPDAARYSDLHAKAYFGEDANNKRHLYLGSLNASRNGMVNNVEALVHLRVRRSRLSFDNVVRTFVGDDKRRGPFAPFVPSDGFAEVDDGELGFRRSFQVAAKAIEFKQVSVEPFDGAYRMEAAMDVLAVPGASADIALTIRPLLGAHEQSLPLESGSSQVRLEFAPLALEQVSALFVLKGTDDAGHAASCVFVCPRDRFDAGKASTEERGRALLEAILSAHGGSLALYIAHAFGIEASGYETGEAGFVQVAPANAPAALPPALYERLLEKAYSEPEAIRRAEYLMDLIPEGVATEQVDGLKRMVEAFRRAVL